LISFETVISISEEKVFPVVLFRYDFFVPILTYSAGGGVPEALKVFSFPHQSITSVLHVGPTFDMNLPGMFFAKNIY
jgi:hypothetical protein